MIRLRESMSLGVPLGVLVITVLAVPVMVLGPNGLPRHRRLAAQIEAQHQENLRLGRTLVQLQSEFDAFTTGRRARERAVREELGWVRPDEIIVEVPGQSIRGAR